MYFLLRFKEFQRNIQDHFDFERFLFHHRLLQAKFSFLKNITRELCQLFDFAITVMLSMNVIASAEAQSIISGVRPTEKPKLRPCCVCKETKSARDLWYVSSIFRYFTQSVIDFQVGLGL